MNSSNMVLKETSESINSEQNKHLNQHDQASLMNHCQVKDISQEKKSKPIGVILLIFLSIVFIVLASQLSLFSQKSQTFQDSSPRKLFYDTPTMLCFLGQDKPFVQDMRYQLSPNEILVNTRYPPIVMVTDKTDNVVSGYIMNYGTWEPTNLKTFSRFVHKGSNILNIGAHIGLEGVVLAKKYAQGTGKLFFFEPYMVSKRILEKNVYLNGLDQITTIYNVAASDKKGRAKMRIVSSNTGMTFMVKEQGEGTLVVGPGEQLIEMNTVDDTLPSDVKIDFALLDTEMSEIEVLQGMKETIKRNPNLTIVTEFTGYSKNMGPEEYARRRDAIFSWLYEQKYSIYKIDRASLAIGSTPRSCDPEKFLKMSDVEIKTLRQQIDIFIIPNTLDPNTMP